MQYRLRSIGGRITSGFGVAVLVLAAYATLAGRTTQKLADRLDLVVTAQMQARRQDDLQRLVREALTTAKDYLITGDATARADHARLREAVAASRRQLEATHSYYRTTCSRCHADGENSTEEGLGWGETFDQEWPEVMRLADAVLARPDPVGDRQAAREVVEMDARADHLVHALGRMSNRLDHAARQAAGETRASSAEAAWLMPLLGLVAVGALLWVSRTTTLGITTPLARVVAAIRALARGDLQQAPLELDTSGEVGELARSLDDLLARLGRLVRRADAIAAGNLDAARVEEAMRDRALTLAEAATACGDEAESGDLVEAFAKMERQLRILTVQARLLSRDQLSHPALELHLEGELGESFEEVCRRLRRLAGQAETIARGDLRNESPDLEAEGELTSAFASMVERLHLLAEQAEALAAGKLNAAVLDRQVPGDVGAAFSRMVENLRDLLGVVRDLGNQTSVTSVELMSASEEMLRGARAQSEKLAAVTAAMTQMSASIQHMAESSSSSAQLALATTESAQAGLAVVDETERGLGEIQAASEDSGNRMRALAEASRQIGKTVEVIQEVAEQTNFLALNAAIEAARAGQQGKGFAVVADEVRKLAERSDKNARDIGAIVARIREEMTTTLDATQRGVDAAGKGRELSAQLVHTFEGIRRDVGDTHRAIAEITEAINQQAHASDQVAMAVDGVDAISRDVSTAAGEIVNQSDQLTKVVATLEATLARFEV